jgi:hypothetical protein
MDDVEAAAFEPMRDRAPAEPKPGELRAGNHAVLAVCERRDQAVKRMRATFCIYFMHNCTRVSHGPDGGGEIAPTDHRIATKPRGRSSDE